MRRVELLQNTVGALLHLGLGPPLGLVETLLPGAGPLALGQGEVLLAAVEPLGGVEEEVVLRNLRGDVQEGLELAQLAPRLLDELVAVHDVDLVQGEVAHPPSHHTYDYMEAFLGGHLLLFTLPDAFELGILGTGCKNGTPLSVTKGRFTVY